MEPLVRVMIIELLPVSMFLKSRETCPNQPAPLHRVGVASSEITAGDTITGDSPYPQGANQFRMRLDFVLFRHTALGSGPINFAFTVFGDDVPIIHGGTSYERSFLADAGATETH